MSEWRVGISGKPDLSGPGVELIGCSRLGDFPETKIGRICSERGGYVRSFHVRTDLKNL
jgi:hypothetical protein